MKTFDFIQVTISHNLKDLHSKGLGPDCLSPLLTVTTQSLGGEVRMGVMKEIYHFKNYDSSTKFSISGD